MAFIYQYYFNICGPASLTYYLPLFIIVFGLIFLVLSLLLGQPPQAAMIVASLGVAAAASFLIVIKIMYCGMFVPVMAKVVFWIVVVGVVGGMVLRKI